jgi:hypothetical protein
VSRSGCMAVGNYMDVKNAGHNMAARRNGSKWRTFKLPGGFGYGGGLINGLSGPTDISCPTLSSCPYPPRSFVRRLTVVRWPGAR